MTSSKEAVQRLRDWEDAYTRLDNALSHFEQQGCEPDPYQQADLVHALAAFSDGLYGISAIRANDALIVARDRSPISKARDRSSQLTVAELRTQLDQIRQEGVKARSAKSGRLLGPGSTMAA